MASPVQTIEARQHGPTSFYWAHGIGKRMERPELTLKPRLSLFEAQIDELIAKGMIGQDRLIAICRSLRSTIPGAVVSNPGIKKRDTIVEKIKHRGKKVEQLNDVSRATVTFSHLEELYAADAWVQETFEYQMAQMSGGARKNRWVKHAPDGEYKDIKFFLALVIPGTVIPWLAELQLNLKIAMRGKSIGHGIYEITRLGDEEGKLPIVIPADKVLRIAQKLQSCYVSLKKTNVDPALLKHFRAFINRHFGKLLDVHHNSNCQPTSVMIQPGERKLLGRVSIAVYTHSHFVASNALAYKNGGLHPVMRPGDLMDAA
jgi:hypothetical protein